MQSETNDIIIEKYNKTKTGLGFAIFLVVILFVIIFIYNHNRYDDKIISDDWALYDLRHDYDSLNRNYESLLSDYEKSQSAWDIGITSLSVGNTDYYRNWINKPGTNLTSSEMRYPAFEITYNSTIERNVIFYIKLFEPDGYLWNSSQESLPPGFSFSREYWVSKGYNNTLEIYGWGHSEYSIFRSGIWTVEIWYDDMCLRTERVTIY